MRTAATACPHSRHRLYHRLASPSARTRAAASPLHSLHAAAASTRRISSIAIHTAKTLLRLRDPGSTSASIHLCRADAYADPHGVLDMTRFQHIAQGRRFLDHISLHGYSMLASYQEEVEDVLPVLNKEATNSRTIMPTRTDDELLQVLLRSPQVPTNAVL